VKAKAQEPGCITERLNTLEHDLLGVQKTTLGLKERTVCLEKFLYPNQKIEAKGQLVERVNKLWLVVEGGGPESQPGDSPEPQCRQNSSRVPIMARTMLDWLAESDPIYPRPMVAGSDTDNSLAAFNQAYTPMMQKQPTAGQPHGFWGKIGNALKVVGSSLFDDFIGYDPSLTYASYPGGFSSYLPPTYDSYYGGGISSYQRSSNGSYLP